MHKIHQAAEDTVRTLFSEVLDWHVQNDDELVREEDQVEDTFFYLLEQLECVAEWPNDYELGSHMRAAAMAWDMCKLDLFGPFVLRIAIHLHQCSVVSEAVRVSSAQVCSLMGRWASEPLQSFAQMPGGAEVFDSEVVDALFKALDSYMLLMRTAASLFDILSEVEATSSAKSD
jgi:hypothetical protein